MIWISFAILIGTIVVSLALLRSDRGDALGIPLVAIGTFTFLYVIQPMHLILTGDGDLFLTHWQFAEGDPRSSLDVGFFHVGLVTSQQPAAQCRCSLESTSDVESRVWDGMCRAHPVPDLSQAIGRDRPLLQQTARSGDGVGYEHCLRLRWTMVDSERVSHDDTK